MTTSLSRVIVACTRYSNVLGIQTILSNTVVVDVSGISGEDIYIIPGTS